MSQEHPLVFSAALPGQKRSQLYRLNPDGSGRILIPTGNKPAFYPIWSPDGKEIVFSSSEAEAAPRFVVSAEAKTAPKPLPKTPSYAWTAGNSATEIQLPSGQTVHWVSQDDKGITEFEVHDTKQGKRTVSIRPRRDAGSFNDVGISGGILGLEPLPSALNAVLGWQLAGGNREGKWRVGLKIDLTTGVGTYWGEYGFSGMSFAPDGKRFITCFNRVNPTTEHEEHTLCLGQTAHPQALRRLVRASGLIVADWRGGLRTTPYSRT